MRKHPLSVFLTDLDAHFKEKNSISLQDLLDLFDKRGHAFFLFLFALPAALPVPAVGLGTILSLPLLFVAFQLLIGRASIWVPRGMAQKKIPYKRFDGLIQKALPWVEKLEVLFKPRLNFLTHGPAENFFGLAMFIIALAVALPLPLTNTVPSMAIAIIAVGIIMSDGLAVIAGLLLGICWISMLAALFLFLGMEGLELIHTAFDTIKSYIGL